MSEAPESLGVVRPTVSVRKPAAKVVVLGDSSVGKSSVIAYLKSGLTTDKLKQLSTLWTTATGEFTIDVEGGSVRLNLWDTCGGEQFRTLTTSFFRGAHGAVLVYDVTHRASFINLFQAHKSSRGLDVIPSWLDQFLDHFKKSDSSMVNGEPPHIAILGNKADITDKRTVDIEEAQRTIDREMKARGVEYLFYETSARTGENLDEFKKQFASKFEGCLIASFQGIVLQSPEPAPKHHSQKCASRC